MQGSSYPALLGCRTGVRSVFAYAPVTLFGRPFQDLSANRRICNSTMSGPTTPGGMPPGLGCSAFARRYSRNHVCFLFLRVLRWFTSPGSLPSPNYSAPDDCLKQPGSPIRKSTGQWLLAPHRRLSQLAASFIAFTRQGIHRVPLVA
jgi:hypothetical protein